MERVNKRAREINQRLSVHWYKQLLPLNHCEPINYNIRTTKCERINKIDKHNLGNDRIQAVINRITDKQSINPAELARETEKDAE